MIKLDLVPSCIKPVLHASQYDDGRQWVCQVLNDGAPFVFQNGDTVDYTIRKGDGLLVTGAVAVTPGTSTLTLVSTEQMCAVYGSNLGELTITSNGAKVGSVNFILEVERAPDEGGVQSQSEINNLARQVHDIVAEELADNGAEETGYDNTESGLDATNVQDALDELAQKPSVDAYTKQESDEKYATKTELSAKADVSAIPTKTSQLQNDSGFAEIDDTQESASKTWSSEKIEAVVKPISDKVDATTEGGVSKNIYPTSYLSEVSGITYSNGVFSGTASSYSNATPLTSFEENTQYTAQVTARRVSGSTTTGNGIMIGFKYSDNTSSNVYVPNSETTFSKYTLTSTSGKTVVKFYFAYASGGSNVWETKQVQVEKGTTATPYVDPDASTLTAIDKVAREKFKELPWWSRFQNEFLRIAYSAIWVDKINTATHWLFASDMGFNVLKGDVEITSDGELIMCHDNGFTFDGNGRITTFDSGNCTLIKNMTYAECRSKFYADNPSRYGGYCPVADIDDFIRICKDKGKICFVTIRSTNTDAVVAKLVSKIKYYGMESKTIINSVGSSLLDVVRDNAEAKGIALNFVASEGQAITNANVDKCIELGDCFLTIWDNGSTTVIDNSATAIAYAKQKGVPLLSAQTGSNSFWNYLIKKGIMGSQIVKPIFDVEPKNQRFSVKMTNGTPTFENLFASNRFTATVSVSGLRIYVSDVCITDSYLTNVIDGIQPIKMNMLNPDIKCVDTSGNSYTCVWSTAHNRFEITIPDTSDRTYRVLVTV